ncbi:MAG TPA: glycosyl transferase, partial [Edaphobacter sp.]|nr:glycosyl transferase [Edaphobacter sp.]
MSRLSGRVLICKLGAIGDVIMTLPAAYALYRAGYEIDWICGTNVQALLDCYNWIHTIAVDDKAILHGRPRERIGALISLWRTAGRAQYDLCATLYYDPRYRILCLPVRAKRKIMLSRTTREAMLLDGRHHTDEYA